MPGGSLGSPAFSFLFSAMHPEEHAVPGCEPGKEGCVLRPGSLISSSCSLPELLSTLIWFHRPPLQDELTLLLGPAHFSLWTPTGTWLECRALAFCGAGEMAHSVKIKMLAGMLGCVLHLL